MGVIKTDFVDVMAMLSQAGQQEVRFMLDAWKVTLLVTSSNPLQIRLNGALISPLCDISGTLGAGHLSLILGGAMDARGPILLDDVLSITTDPDYERDAAQAFVMVKEYYVETRIGPDVEANRSLSTPRTNAKPSVDPGSRQRRADPVRTYQSFGRKATGGK